MSVGVGGKCTCGVSNIVGQEENGSGLEDDVSDDETKDKPFKIGRGAAAGI